MATIDLGQLPASDVVETFDYESLLAERKATLISLYPTEQQDAIARADAGIRAHRQNAAGKHLSRADPASAYQRGGKGQYGGVCAG